jgi:hypothetical protein
MWEELSAEEQRLLLNAWEEGYLFGVIGDFLGHAEHGGAMWVGSQDKEAITGLIPRFREVVTSMVERGLVEVRDTPTGDADDGVPLGGAELQAALEDPDVWMYREDRVRMLALTLTEAGLACWRSQADAGSSGSGSGARQGA